MLILGGKKRELPTQNENIYPPAKLVEIRLFNTTNIPKMKKI